MTRQEVIERLKSIKSLVDKYDDVMALREAIKVLEQEPKFIAKSDGTIEQIKNCDDCLFKKEWEKIGKLISVVLEKQNDAEYHGNEDMDGLYYCPICQQTTTVVKDGKCPKCGATMDELSTREQTEDAISRQATLEPYKRLKDTDTLCVALIRANIMQQPSVNPQEPKTGHWEWEQYYYYPNRGNWHCSECKCVVTECVDKNEKGGIPLYKCCPQCGTKMIEPKESEAKCKNCEYYRNPDYTRCHECKAGK